MATPWSFRGPPAPGASITAYALAVAITVASVLSQYVVPGTSSVAAAIYGTLVGSLLIVYGIPIVAFAVLVGADPIRRYSVAMGKATWEGLRWYGVLTLLGLFVTIVLASIYLAVDPGALKLLSRPNPVLQSAAGDPAFWIAFSFVVGALEETIFRGWIFGFWANRPGSPWLVHAIWTSALFAGVHLYYGITYGIAAPLVYPTLFLLGLSFALTFHFSGGNLVVVSLLHGANDAASFLSIVSVNAGLAVHYGIVGIGVVIALLHSTGTRPFDPKPSPPTVVPPPPSGWSPPPSEPRGPTVS